MRDVDPDADAVSPDLPVELQAKLFEQLAAAGVAGAGLTITLVGTILQGSFLVWVATAEFTLGAIVALGGQTQLIEGLTKKQPIWRKARIISGAATLLIGMGIGSLATDVYIEGKVDQPSAQAPAASSPALPGNGAAGED